MTGSGDIYSTDRRTPTASINFVTAHDGFTLADLTAYDDKHNEANGDGNADGESDNRSWNCGAEGPTDDDAVTELRKRQRRNLIGSVLLAAGVPMILGGDEIGRTQDGNNNAYCQDNETSWYDWETVDHDMLAFVTAAIRLRRDNAALRPREYLRGPEGGPAQLALYRPDGKPMADDDWANPTSKSLSVALDGRQIEDEDGDTSRDRFLLLVNAHSEPVTFVVPVGGTVWRVVLTTDEPVDTPDLHQGDEVSVRDRSLLLMHGR
jgi:glycogen operon protein